MSQARGRRHRVRAVALHLANRHLGRRHRKTGVVGVESAADAGFASQDVRRDEPAGRVAAALEQLGERDFVRLQREAEVVADAVLERQPACEHRDVRRERLRRMGPCALEQDAIRREGIDDGRGNLLVAVHRQVVRPKRVDRNQDDRATVDRRRARPSPAQPAERRPPPAPAVSSKEVRRLIRCTERCRCSAPREGPFSSLPSAPRSGAPSRSPPERRGAVSPLQVIELDPRKCRKESAWQTWLVCPKIHSTVLWPSLSTGSVRSVRPRYRAQPTR